jgi:hypothetical protein
MRGFYLTAAAFSSDSDLTSSGNRGCGDGNGVDSACGACGHQCGDSVYCTYDHHDDDDVIHPSLHPLSE